LSLPSHLAAALADRYRLERELGQGGMATVYLAEDLRHKRRVAIKVLKPDLAAVLGGDRFVQEITTTAALQHPHILPLFDSGTVYGPDKSGPYLFYVMPFVEGETLRSKLDRERQLGIEESVRIAREVADALDYAHRHGVIHRDIKPENILLHDGRATVADFGIALAVSAAAGGRMTETGLSLGTPHYMSPEQATAEREITGRSDIYSLGCVLYEMLTGNPPHTGATAQQIIMKIVTEEAAPVTKLRRAVPHHVADAVAQAVEKLPADRFGTAKEFAEALGGEGRTARGPAGRRTTTVHGNPALQPSGLPAILSAALVLTAALAVWGWLRPEAPREVSRFSVFMPDSQLLATGVNGTRIAVSPDGRTIAYVGGEAGGTPRLWVRALDQVRATPLAGTEFAANPTFSPDGKRIAFVTSQTPRELRVVPAGGGPVLTLADSLVDLGGASWGDDGYVYYDGHLEGDGIARVREAGGKPEPATRPNSSRGENYHFMPAALPGGRGVLYTAMLAGGVTELGVWDAKRGEHRRLMPGLIGRYAASGHLVVVIEGGTLMAAPFDLDRLELTGDAVVLAEDISVRGNQRTDVALSASGLAVYASGGAVGGGARHLVWVTREGVVTEVDPSYSAALGGRPSLSPDGRAVALTTGLGTQRQVWVKQLDRGPAARVAESGFAPSWVPGGERLVLASPSGIHTVPASGVTRPSPIGIGNGGAPVYSPDGKWLVFMRQGDLFIAGTAGDTVPRVIVSDPNSQGLPTISPDGRWLAYPSDETGTYQVYVRSFPDVDRVKRQVSVSSGWAPRWSRDGRELFFVSIDARFWSVRVNGSGAFTSEEPQPLFSAEQFGSLAANFFDVHPDGRRFLFTRAVGRLGDRPDEMIVVQHFVEELKVKVPR